MESSMLVAVATCLLVVLLVKWLLGDGKKRPPGPWGLPIVGYIPFLSRLPHLNFCKLAQKYGNIYSLRLGSHYVVVLNDFESSKEAFNNDAFFGRPPDQPFDLNEETIETQAFRGPPWKEQRRFSLHMLRDLGFGKSRMEAQLQEEINELLGHWEKDAGKPILPRDLLASSMSNNISTLVYGKRLPYNDPVRQMMSRVLNKKDAAAGQVTWQLFFPWLRKLCKVLGIFDVDRISKIAEELRQYTMKEIEEHEATLNSNNIRDYIDGYLLEIIKRKDDPSFCKPVLQDMVGAFFGAGSETVRLTVDWLILGAAANPDAQRRVQAEIDDVIGHERLPLGPDVKSMPYTEAFISEHMRWRTIIPVNILRYTLTDSVVNGFFIDKHSQVLSNLWAIHHDKEYWGNDAEEFRPERFLTKDGKAVKKWERFIPFSIGKRSCPGEPLAKVEVFLYFTSILQRFDIRLPKGKKADFEGELGIGLMPKPQEIVFTKRS